MNQREPEDLTAVLKAVGRGDSGAERELFDRIYDELRRIARRELHRESDAPTLIQTTDLVNEAYLKLVRKEPANWDNRRHFFGAAVRAMRQILIDYARRKHAVRHGGGQDRITLSDSDAAGEASFEILALNEALDRLATIQPRAAKVVEYRFFLGLSVKESAELLEVSPRTVNTEWLFASTWLRREISNPPSSA